MILHDHDRDTHPVPDGWQTVAIIGGPHAGQRFTIHEEQDDLELFDGPAAHRYVRCSGRPVLYHESLVVRMFTGGRR